MLQYIINSSIIWLAGLLLFEFVFRKESFHQLNRIFLIVCLVAGLMLPNLNLNGIIQDNNIDNTFINTSRQVSEIKKVIQVKQVEEIHSTISSSANNIENVVWGTYLAGCFLGILFLIWEIFQLFSLYLKGSKYSEQGCTIVETEKNHCPFSFLNIIFIRSREDYNQTQWDFLISHEKVHKNQLHFIDNLLMILLRIVCWFNPLIHIYYKRLRIVHEYQADQAASASTAEYGTFLIEQSLLQGAPILSHSFNYSPIKTRIAMLTKTRSTRSKLLKYLTIFPILFLLIIFCTQSSFSGEINKKGKKTNFKGNEIEFGELKAVPYEHLKSIEQHKKMFLKVNIPDSFPVYDYAKGTIIRMEPTRLDVMPITLNGAPIYGNEIQYFLSDLDGDYKAPVLNQPGNNLEEFLFSKLKKELDKLEEGVYRFGLNRMVVDQLGSLAYFENEGISIFMGPDEKQPIISQNIKGGIDQKLIELLNESVKFKPALKDGKPVNVRLYLGNYRIVVKNHKAIIAEGGGC